MTYPKAYPASDHTCPVRRSLSVIGGKWSLLILFQINTRVIRFAELRRQIPGISEKVLSDQLKSLVDEGLVTRTSYDVVPPRVEYSLTEKGKDTLPIIDKIVDFGLKNLSVDRVVKL